MLPAHGYPELKKYRHLKGNFGTAWQNQQKEFANVPAPILFTTNCLMPPKDSYSDRVFTTEVVSYPKITHIGDDKDFTPIIEKALELGGYDEDKQFTGINGGTSVTTGFGHGTILSVADKVIEDVYKRQPVLPYFLSFAAGAMMYVVIEELIPEMSHGNHSNIGTVMFAVGFTLMMILDVALG